MKEDTGPRGEKFDVYKLAEWLYPNDPESQARWVRKYNEHYKEIVYGKQISKMEAFIQGVEEQKKLKTYPRGSLAFSRLIIIIASIALGFKAGLWAGIITAIVGLFVIGKALTYISSPKV